MKSKNNTIVIILLIALMILIVVWVSDEARFIERMQFDELVKYPEMATTVYAANTVECVILYFIGVNISESKRKLKKFVKSYGILATAISTVITFIMLSYI